MVMTFSYYWLTRYNCSLKWFQSKIKVLKEINHRVHRWKYKNVMGIWCNLHHFFFLFCRFLDPLLLPVAYGLELGWARRRQAAETERQVCQFIPCRVVFNHPKKNKVVRGDGVTITYESSEREIHVKLTRRSKVTPYRASKVEVTHMHLHTPNRELDIRCPPANIGNHTRVEQQEPGTEASTWSCKQPGAFYQHF